VRTGRAIARLVDRADLRYTSRMTQTSLRSVALCTLLLGACSQGTETLDTGAAAPDAVGAVDAFAGDDAFAPSDAPPPSGDAPVAPRDAPGSDDAFVSGDAAGSDDAAIVPPDPDGGFAGDTGTIGAGECDATACTPTCFRAITCVKECGGPATECGCCACATGSFDAITCGTST
jgi:hypothetical protein